MALRLAGQVFDRMSKLTAFAGCSRFWDLLTPEYQAEYAGICRRNRTEVLFELDKWIASDIIQLALAEYNDEAELEANDPRNAATLF